MRRDQTVRPLLWFINLGVGALAVVGCGRSSGLTRVMVSGTVTLDGSPVEDGQIHYVPIQGTAGPVTIAPIRNGKYTCDAKGGVPVGKHRVEILAWDPKAPYGGRGEPPRPQWAPEKYNTNSELTAVIAEGDMPHDFAVKNSDEGKAAR